MPSAEAVKPVAISSLIDSLAGTIAQFPHFAGQLYLTSYPSDESSPTSHSQRFRRCAIRYGYESDPGVEVVTAQASTQLRDFLPVSILRKEGSTSSVDLTHLPLQALIPKSQLPISDTVNRPDLPGLSVQLTLFPCGSIAFGLRAAHPLADITTLSEFVNFWGRTHHAGQTHGYGLNPIFDPKLLEDQIPGNIDAENPDPSLIIQSRELPLHKYDWWAPSPHCPRTPTAKAQSEIPPEVPAAVASARFQGNLIPWEEWDHTPTSHTLIYLSAEEVDDMYKSAAEAGPGLRFTSHDVLLALFWIFIVRAKHDMASGDVSLDLSIGLRTRLGIPQSYAGSPILLTGIVAPTDTLVGAEFIETLASVASTIRKHINVFDKDAIGAHLHEMVFDIAPHRFWRGFFGLRHTLATSWIRAGLYHVNFGWGTPVWVASEVSNIDGIVVIMEAGKVPGNARATAAGIHVDLNLTTKATESLLKSLREWKSSRNI